MRTFHVQLRQFPMLRDEVSPSEEALLGSERLVFDEMRETNCGLLVAKDSLCQESSK